MDEPQPDFPANDQSQSSIDAEEKLIENEKKNENTFGDLPGENLEAAPLPATN